MARVPSPVPGCDVRSLPLNPTEAYVLSRIDGVTSDSELSTTTGLAPSEVVAALQRLFELGVIHFAAETRAGPSHGASAAHPAHRSDPDLNSRRKLDSAPDTSPRSDIPRSDVRAVRAPRDPLDSSGPVSSSRSPFGPNPPSDRGDAAEHVDIEPEKRKRIRELYEALDQKSYYELLGILEDASKKEVKSAYYALAPEFHPDKYFRKNLGSFKQKIEATFARLTLAHDVLTSKERRAAYDEYVAQARKNRAMTDVLEQTSSEIATAMAAVELAAIEPVVAPPPSARGSADARPPVRSPSQPDARSPVRTPSQTDFRAAILSAPQSDRSPPSSARAPSPPDSRAPQSDKERRESFARKLLGGASRASRGSWTEDAGLANVRPIDPKVAAEALRARFLASRAASLRGQVERYLETGRQALEQKDYAQAANAYRVAASLVPEDADVEKRAAEAQKLAAIALAAGYFKQADYEAGQGRWGDAALSYTKVCAGRPDDPSAHDRAAFAVLKASGNTRKAVELARRAVTLAPSVPEFHLTLARAYLAAGLEVSAKGEIQRALELAPNDAKIHALAADVRREAQGG